MRLRSFWAILVIVGALCFLAVLFIARNRAQDLKTEIRDSDRLRIGIFGRPSSLNIFKAKDLNTHVVLAPIHRGLVKFNYLGQVESALAESWQIDQAKRRIDFQLKSELKCSDIIQSFERAKVAVRTPLTNFEAHCLPDGTTLRLENVQDAESLFPLLGRIYFAILPAALLSNEIHGQGYGPFKLVTNRPDFIEMERIDRSKDGPLAIDFKIYKTVPEGIDAFKRNEVDILPLTDSGLLEPSFLKYVHTSPVYSTIWFLSFGSKKSTWTSAVARSCLNWKINRAAITKSLNTNGIEFAVPAFSVLSGRGKMAEFRPTLPDTLDKCPRAKNVRVEVTYSAESASKVAISSLFLELSRLGYVPVGVPLEKRKYVERLISGDFDLVFGGFGASDSLKESVLTFYSESSNFKFVPRPLSLSSEDFKKFELESMMSDENVFDLQSELWRRSAIIPILYMRPATLVRGCFELEASNTHNPILNLDSVRRRAKCENE